jgi:hypothetical protein
MTTYLAVNEVAGIGWYKGIAFVTDIFPENRRRRERQVPHSEL